MGACLMPTNTDSSHDTQPNDLLLCSNHERCLGEISKDDIISRSTRLLRMDKVKARDAPWLAKARIFHHRTPSAL